MDLASTLFLVFFGLLLVSAATWLIFSVKRTSTTSDPSQVSAKLGHRLIVKASTVVGFISLLGMVFAAFAFSFGRGFCMCVLMVAIFTLHKTETLDRKRQSR